MGKERCIACNNDTFTVRSSERILEATCTKCGGGITFMRIKKTASSSRSAGAVGYEPDYAYSTIEEYEKITGIQVNEAFRIGWGMARVINNNLRKLAGL